MTDTAHALPLLPPQAAHLADGHTPALREVLITYDNVPDEPTPERIMSAGAVVQAVNLCGSNHTAAVGLIDVLRVESADELAALPLVHDCDLCREHRTEFVQSMRVRTGPIIGYAVHLATIPLQALMQPGARILDLAPAVETLEVGTGGYL